MWWDAETGKTLRRKKAHARWIRAVTAAPDGKTIASVADDMVGRIWNSESGELLHELHGHAPRTPNHYPSMLFSCAFSADGAHLATADKVGHIVVWDLKSGREVSTMEAPVMYTWDPKQRRHSIGGVRSLAFSPDGGILAAGGIGKIGNIDHLGAKARVEIFDWRKGERVHEFPGADKSKGIVEHLAFHHSGDWLLAGGGDNNGFIMFLDLKSKKIIHQEKAPMHVHELALNETSDTLYAVGHNRLAVWELQEGS